VTGIEQAGPPPGTDEQPPDPGAGKAIPARAVPGQPDMWVLVLFEALVFTAYFAVYLYHRSADSELFLRSQAQLNPWLGTLDTLLLLTSSLFMLRCAQAARAGAHRAAMTNAYITACLGVAFLISKITEWIMLVRGGHAFSSNDFFMYYFFLTGIHLLHLLIGFITIGVIIYQLRGPARRSRELVETCAVYWHTVDLLWVLIFSLLYVVR
jgi:nitric oxide reductase NorE protein